MTDLEQVPNMVRGRVAGVITQAIDDSPEGSVLNVVLRIPSLSSDVQALLNAEDAYNVDLFMEQIAQVLQSNDESVSDDNLVLIVTRYRKPKYADYTFIAHNAAGFDNYILLEYFVKQWITPMVTMRGSRVILMYDRVLRQRWIDSFSFLPMRLSKTPAALGFEDLMKGYFPHKFNTRANEYIGCYPTPYYYGYDAMCDRDKNSFMGWYATVRNDTFDFQAEIRRYCINDVEVLRRACTVYRESFLECTQLDPFAFTTLASSCMGVFKTMFLPADTVALTYEDTLQERVLYCDTDSAVFTSRAGDMIPPLGSYLGDLTDEIKDGDVCGLPEEDYITEFVSGGPKCYAYYTRDGKTQVKCKGVTLNAKNATVVTPASLISLVHGFVANQNPNAHMMTASDTITRDKKQFHLRNATVLKKVQVVYNKRRVLSDYTTLPYGY
ncbi:hypothetical protein VZT92_005785 [Zoarces viviparus]|uniref:DNA-directed DNA polymerase n=1 Tax=Zoarces viviparus TaxID=48416 RepID=A0AAW1FMQ7_ZOAVI